MEIDMLTSLVIASLWTFACCNGAELDPRACVLIKCLQGTEQQQQRNEPLDVHRQQRQVFTQQHQPIPQYPTPQQMVQPIQFAHPNMGHFVPSINNFASDAYQWYNDDAAMPVVPVTMATEHASTSEVSNTYETTTEETQTIEQETEKTEMPTNEATGDVFVDYPESNFKLDPAMVDTDNVMYQQTQEQYIPQQQSMQGEYQYPMMQNHECNSPMPMPDMYFDGQDYMPATRNIDQVSCNQAYVQQPQGEYVVQQARQVTPVASNNMGAGVGMPLSSVVSQSNVIADNLGSNVIGPMVCYPLYGDQGSQSSTKRGVVPTGAPYYAFFSADKVGNPLMSGSNGYLPVVNDQPAYNQVQPMIMLQGNQPGAAKRQYGDHVCE